MNENYDAILLTNLIQKRLMQAGRVLAKVPQCGGRRQRMGRSFRAVESMAWLPTQGPLKDVSWTTLGVELDITGIVAQRLKRMPTIISKLERLPWLRLSRMQDVGGCRDDCSDVQTMRLIWHATNLLLAVASGTRLVAHKNYH